MNSKKLARFLRAVLAGDFDFDAPSHRASSNVALFLAGMGAGVLVGMLFAPVSGEQLRSDLGNRARESMEKAKSKSESVRARSSASGVEKLGLRSEEKSAS